MRETWQHKGARPNPKTGTPQHTPRPPFNTATTQTKGGRRYQTRGTPTLYGRVNTGAPALHSPCHPTPSCHPTIHNAPTHHHCEGVVDRGCPTTRTAQTYITTHTPHHLATRQCTTRRSTRTPCTGSRWHRSHALDSAGQRQHTPPPFNEVHEQDGHHPLSHLTLFTFTQPTNDQ